MFLMGLIFLLILGLIFGVVLLVIRPTATERTIAGRVAKLQVGQNAELDDPTAEIVKHVRLSQIPWLDALLRRWSLVRRIQLMIAQAESSWSVSGVLAGSVALAAAGYAIGYYELSSAALALLPAAVFAA